MRRDLTFVYLAEKASEFTSCRHFLRTETGNSITNKGMRYTRLTGRGKLGECFMSLMMLETARFHTRFPFS